MLPISGELEKSNIFSSRTTPGAKLVILATFAISVAALLFALEIALDEFAKRGKEVSEALVAPFPLYVIFCLFFGISVCGLLNTYPGRWKIGIGRENLYIEFRGRRHAIAWKRVSFVEAGRFVPSKRGTPLPFEHILLYFGLETHKTRHVKAIKGRFEKSISHLVWTMEEARRASCGSKSNNLSRRTEPPRPVLGEELGLNDLDCSRIFRPKSPPPPKTRRWVYLAYSPVAAAVFYMVFAIHSILMLVFAKAFFALSIPWLIFFAKGRNRPGSRLVWQNYLIGVSKRGLYLSCDGQKSVNSFVYMWDEVLVARESSSIVTKFGPRPGVVISILSPRVGAKTVEFPCDFEVSASEVAATIMGGKSGGLWANSTTKLDDDMPTPGPSNGGGTVFRDEEDHVSEASEQESRLAKPILFAAHASAALWLPLIIATTLSGALGFSMVCLLLPFFLSVSLTLIYQKTPSREVIETNVIQNHKAACLGHVKRMMIAIAIVMLCVHASKSSDVHFLAGVIMLASLLVSAIGLAWRGVPGLVRLSQGRMFSKGRTAR